MKKLEWYNLKACKEIRVQTLIKAGFNLKTDYFCLDGSKMSILCECMKADGYRYDSPLGRSRSRSYWYSLQRSHPMWVRGLKHYEGWKKML